VIVEIDVSTLVELILIYSSISFFVLSQTFSFVTVLIFVFVIFTVRVHSQHLGTLLQDVNNKAEDSIMIMCFI
jgi:hypothetical protein